MSVVDAQQELLYTAQWEAFKGTEVNAALSGTECIGFNKTLFSRAVAKGYWLGSYVPQIYMKATLGEYAGIAYYSFGKVEGAHIELTSNGKRGWIIAHEAAHIILCAGRPMHKRFEPHGPEYAAVYIWAISALFGTKWSNRLKRAFAEARIQATCSLKED